MKTRNGRPLSPSLLAGYCVILGLGLGLTCSPLQADTDTWTAVTTGTYNWSSGANWLSGNAPGTASDDLIFSDLVGSTTAVTSQPDPTWSLAGGVNSLTFGVASGDTNAGTYTFLSPGGFPLSIGAGGITSYFTTGSVNIGGTTMASAFMGVNLTANQTWNISGTTNGFGRLVLNGDMTGSGNLTKAGTGELIFNNGSSSSWTGTFTVANGLVALATAAELGRLGSSVTMGGGPTTAAPAIQFGGLTTAGVHNQFTANLLLGGITSGSYTFQIGSLPTAAAGVTLDFTGTLSSSGALTQTVKFQDSNSGAAVNDPTTGTDIMFRLFGDGSNLTSTLASSAITISQSFVELDNANALGVGNRLSVNVGSSPAAAGGNAGFYTTNGINVASNISTAYNTRSGATLFSDTYLGLDGTGSANFTGTITLSTAGSASAFLNPANNVNLRAVSGGAVTFSGTIIDLVGGTNPAAKVTAQGGGTVILSSNGNTYKGGTAVIGGTTLLATNTSGSATGVGALQVGYDGGTPTATTTASSPVVTVSSTTGLGIGQTVTGTGIPANTTIAAILSPTSIQLSQNATAAGSIALTAAATTGILGGSGIIAPTGANGTVVANGSSIAPGAGGTISTLTFNGVGTSAPQLTLETGASLTFLLGASNASDEIKLTNYVAGDLVLNGNTLNFTNAQAGTFTLFQFYTNAGTVLTADGITGGLVLGSGLNGYTATINYDADDISVTLALAAVPEPSVWVLSLLGGGLVIWRRGLSRRDAAEQASC